MTERLEDVRAIKVDVDGTIGFHSGPEDFFMTKDIDWAEGPYPGHDDHAVYYDDNALFAEEQVRTTLAGIDYPLPLWIVGVQGERTADATLEVDKVIEDLGERRFPLFED